uniref:(northern house mosquito) hypothetical protein n=1 Tax=Culex pipiens TaxID=7175 RepID=A0A8D8C389_CULPI
MNPVLVTAKGSLQDYKDIWMRWRRQPTSYNNGESRHAVGLQVLNNTCIGEQGQQAHLVEDSTVHYQHERTRRALARNIGRTKLIFNVLNNQGRITPAQR